MWPQKSTNSWEIEWRIDMRCSLIFIALFVQTSHLSVIEYRTNKKLFIHLACFAAYFPSVESLEKEKNPHQINAQHRLK